MTPQQILEKIFERSLTGSYFEIKSKDEKGNQVFVGTIKRINVCGRHLTLITKKISLYRNGILVELNGNCAIEEEVLEIRDVNFVSNLPVSIKIKIRRSTEKSWGELNI